MKKIFLLSFFFVGQCLLESCCNVEPICFEMELTGVSNFSFTQGENLTLLDTIPANDYAIRLESVTGELICMSSFTSGNNLNAWSCDDDLTVLQNRIENVSITSNADLNDNFPAGVELKPLFIAVGLNVACIERAIEGENCIWDYSPYIGGESIEAVINNYLSVNFFAEQTFEAGAEFFNLLWLNTEEAVTAGQHEFTVRFIFENGDLVELMTNPIVIN